MVIFSIVVLICFMGCCYNGPTSPYGLPRKRIKILLKNIDYGGVDTLAVYKSYANYAYNNLSKKIIYFEKTDDNTYPYVSYLKFYENGKVGLFVISKKDTLNLKRCTFNPKMAKMGYYHITENKIKIKISTLANCNLYISRKKGYINEDTITIEGNNQHGSIYVKKKIPKEFLEDWLPDW